MFIQKQFKLSTTNLLLVHHVRNSTSVDEILRLASSDSRSQANGGSTNTNGAEAPRGPSAEDSLKNSDEIGRSTSVDAILRRATS
jgi:hypothetical protein